MLFLLLIYAFVATFVKTDLIMKSRFLFLLLYVLFSLLPLSAQHYHFAPYYPTLKGLDDYAVWQLVYPDSLLRADVPGEAVCTLLIDTLGHVSDKQISATHPLFLKAAEEVVQKMKDWEPAQKDGKKIDSLVVVRIPFEPEFYRERIWRQQQILDPCRQQAVDAMPVFPDKVRRLVMGNMGWPVDSVRNAVAVCRFTVNADGNIENAHVIEGTHPAFDKEALHILSAFPRLIPARKDGKYVPFDYFLTIRFWKDDFEHYLTNRENARQDLERTRWEPYTYSTYPGGAVALAQSFHSCLEITPEMKATGKQGRVICSFDVDIDGSMKNFQVVRGLHPLMDAEALRVLQLIHGKWSTGYVFNAKKWYREFYVNKYTVPVIFKW